MTIGDFLHKQAIISDLGIYVGCQAEAAQTLSRCGNEIDIAPFEELHTTIQSAVTAFDRVYDALVPLNLVPKMPDEVSHEGFALEYIEYAISMIQATYELRNMKVEIFLEKVSGDNVRYFRRFSYENVDNFKALLEEKTLESNRKLVLLLKEAHAKDASKGFDTMTLINEINTCDSQIRNAKKTITEKIIADYGFKDVFLTLLAHENAKHTS